MLVNGRSVIRGHTCREHRTFTRKGEHVVARMSAEEVSKYPRFRLKVDLSRFLHDARQYCWIFVDSSKMLQIRHIEHHISKLFGIPFPFHLMLNNTEYLPPMEDARILENNETILLVFLVLLRCYASNAIALDCFVSYLSSLPVQSLERPDF